MLIKCKCGRMTTYGFVCVACSTAANYDEESEQQETPPEEGYNITDPENLKEEAQN